MEEIKSIKRIVLLEATWQKCPGMLLHPRIEELPKLKINSYSTIFWRIHDKSHDHLSSIEGKKIQRRFKQFIN